MGLAKIKKKNSQHKRYATGEYISQLYQFPKRHRETCYVDSYV